MRIVTLSHGHAALSPGGAELAAQALHEALALSDGVEALHIACATEGHPWLTLKRGQTRFVAPASLHPLRLFRIDPADSAPLLDTIAAFGPDVIHLHHILGFGADIILALRQRFPAALLVMTLHEFIPICHNQGQMVRPDGALCESAAPERCGECFPAISAERFLRRAHALKSLFSLIDAFVAPSAFLAQRYRDWGIAPSKLVVIENAVAAAPAEPVRETTGRQRRGRFGFFGQLTPFKGVDILLEAVASVPERDWAGNSLVIHGAHLERQPPDFQARVKALLGAAGERVVLKGSYRPHELPRLMAEVDWVVVPSIWWENSPLVIQEAFAHGRPVIASNIGGMAEKVLHGRNGLTVAPGNVPALADTLLVASRADTWSKLRSGVVPPVPAAAIATWHRRLYQTLLEGRKRTAEVA